MLHLAILTNAQCSDKETECAPPVIRHNLSMDRYQIRVATSGDWSALAKMRYRFRAEVGSPTEKKSRFLRRCKSWMKKAFGADSSAWRCWVVDDGKQLLGQVCVQLFEKMPNPVNEPEVHAYLTNFYVVPEMRGRGLGSELLNHALSWCRAHGADAVILWATAESKSLYRRCGFARSADLLQLRRSTGQTGN
jgi:GNAT superfamily N-acetyltransferase